MSSVMTTHLDTHLANIATKLFKNVKSSPTFQHVIKYSQLYTFKPASYLVSKD